MKFRKIIAVGLSLVTISGSVLAINKRRDITDWVILLNFEPSSDIAALSERTGLTSLGQKLFYVYDPQLLSKDSFNTKCTLGEESIVLGCYDGSGIYVYNVSDSTLDGVEEVTSAHEMLHAAYERLSDKERSRIDNLTRQAIETTNNQRVKDLIESYRSRDASIVDNEAHSIVGTELRDIPVELEEYYSRYFYDRFKVVELSEKYEAVFINLKTQVEQIDKELLLKKGEIDNLESTLTVEAGVLQEWEARLSGYRKNNQISEYNSEVDEFNDRVRAYNADLERARSLIAQYNQMVIERNNIALQQNQLIKSLDSKAAEL